MPTRRRRRRPVAIAVAAVLTLTGCLDDGVPDLDSGPVLSTLDRLAGDDPTSGRLDACPIDEFEELVENGVELVDGPLVDAALEGSARSDVVAVETAAEPAAVIRCELTTPGATIGLTLARSPGDRDAHDEFALALDSATAVTRPVEVTNFLSDVYRGGEFVRVCIDHDQPVDDVCFVDWVDRGDLPEDEREDDDEPRALVGLAIRGEGALDIDLRLVEERWRLMLPLVVQRLE